MGKIRRQYLNKRHIKNSFYAKEITRSNSTPAEQGFKTAEKDASSVHAQLVHKAENGASSAQLVQTAVNGTSTARSVLTAENGASSAQLVVPTPSIYPLQLTNGNSTSGKDPNMRMVTALATPSHVPVALSTISTYNSNNMTIISPPHSNSAANTIPAPILGSQSLPSTSFQAPTMLPPRYTSPITQSLPSTSFQAPPPMLPPRYTSPITQSLPSTSFQAATMLPPRYTSPITQSLPSTSFQAPTVLPPPYTSPITHKFPTSPTTDNLYSANQWIQSPPRVPPTPSSPTSFTQSPEFGINKTDQPVQEPVQDTVTAKPPLPPDWSLSVAKANAAFIPFIRIPVGANSKEYSVLASLIEPRVSIISIDRIVNTELSQKFFNTRVELLKSKSKNIGILEDLGLNQEEIDQRMLIHGSTCGPSIVASDYCDNIALLFHCTRGNIDTILTEGLDERLGNENGILGRGIYFADDPRKSILYDQNTTLLIFAVHLGDCVMVHEKDQRTLVREPRKEPHQKRHHNDLCFDSITGSPSGMNEYVIYNRHQCTPLYTVKYKTGSSPWILSPEQLGVAYARAKLPPFSWCRADSNSSIMPPAEVKPWPFYARTIFDAMEESPTSPARTDEDLSKASTFPGRDTVTGDSSGEGAECQICFETYPKASPAPIWKILQCGHQVCVKCYFQLEQKGVSMTGEHHTFIKCPFCQVCSGIEIGTCLDGTMHVTENPALNADGYEGFGVIQVTYTAPNLKRIAYFPANSEGRKVVDLMRVAWNRRLCFSMGTSATTGAQNVLVWNLHHKTGLTGGVQFHGYPDPTYLSRVQEELAQYGIK